MEATHRLERLRQSLVSGGCGPETEARDNPGRICSGEQAEAFVPSDAVGPADVGISCKPAIPTTLGIQNGHRRAVEGLAKTFAVAHRLCCQIQSHLFDEPYLRTHQPIELGTIGQSGKSTPQLGLGITVEVPLAGEAPPTSEDGQSNDLALGEGCFRTGSSFWAPAVAEIVDHDVEYGEEGVHIEHRSSAPFPSGMGGKSTLKCGHLPLNLSSHNSHQAFKGGQALRGGPSAERSGRSGSIPAHA